MSDERLTHHPSPKRHSVAPWRLGYALLGGPLAWWAQLNISYGLAVTPCFPGPERNLQLPGDATWILWVTAIAYLALLAMAVGAGLTAVQVYRKVQGEDAGSDAEVDEAGTGRTRFLAYCAMLLGFGFAAVILVNVAALLVVPPCGV